MQEGEEAPVSVPEGVTPNGNKRKRPAVCITSETGSTTTQDKRMKCDSANSHEHKRRRNENDDEEEEEEEEEASAESQSQGEVNLYSYSQPLSQSASEFDQGLVAPPSSPRHEHDSSQGASQELLLQPRSPKRRALTPQNSSANLDAMLNRTNSEATKNLLTATFEVLSTKVKEPKQSKEKLYRRDAGYIHTPLTAEEKLLKAEKQDIQTVLSPEYWRKVCPKLHVQDQQFMLDTYSKFSAQMFDENNEERLEHWKETMSENGYYETGVIEWGFKVKRLAAAAATLRKLGWHPVWLVMYDEAWLMASSLAGVFKRTVNTKMDFNADFWAWYLDPMLEEKGWEVHRDRFNMPLAESAEPHYATAWVALTEATPKNGCIYVVPARFDPDYATLKESTDFDVQNVRAVPAPAGGAILWSGRTLHFGGRCDKDAEVPRIAISFAASTPAFEDPKMRLMFGDRKQDIVLTVDNGKVTVSNGVQLQQEKEKEKEERGKGKGKGEGKGDEKLKGERRHSFLGKETVSMPGLRTRIGVIATQLWAYQPRIPMSPHLKALLKSLEQVEK